MIKELRRYGAKVARELEEAGYEEEAAKVRQLCAVLCKEGVTGPEIEETATDVHELVAELKEQKRFALGEEVERLAREFEAAAHAQLENERRHAEQRGIVDTQVNLTLTLTLKPDLGQTGYTDSKS